MFKYDVLLSFSIHTAVFGGCFGNITNDLTIVKTLLLITIRNTSILFLFYFTANKNQPVILVHLLRNPINNKILCNTEQVQDKVRNRDSLLHHMVV